MTTVGGTSEPEVTNQPRTVRHEACPMCGGRDSAHLFSIPDRLHGVPGSYAYERCGSCGTVHQNPQVVPDDLTLCYPTDYFTHAEGDTPTFRASPARDRLRALLLAPDGPRAATLLRRVSPLATRARFGLPAPIGMPSSAGDRALEIGPGRGLDLVRLRRLGWDTVGLDVDPHAAQAASTVAGCPVLVGGLDRLAELPSEFGVVYGSHAFEHLPEPRRALEVVHGCLRPGGRVVLVFPNSRSLVCRTYGADAVSWDPPRHLTLPPAKAMVAALERIGYVDVRIRTLPTRAAHYASVSRAYRRGLRGEQSWYEPIGGRDRALAAIEKACTVAGAKVGEELVVSARKRNGDP